MQADRLLHLFSHIRTRYDRFAVLLEILHQFLIQPALMLCTFIGCAFRALQISKTWPNKWREREIGGFGRIRYQISFLLIERIGVLNEQSPEICRGYSPKRRKYYQLFVCGIKKLKYRVICIAVQQLLQPVNQSIELVLRKRTDCICKAG